MKYVIEIEIELPADEEGLTPEGWNIATQLDDAIWKLKTDYGWNEIIQRISNPKSK